MQSREVQSAYHTDQSRVEEGRGMLDCRWVVGLHRVAGRVVVGVHRVACVSWVVGTAQLVEVV